MFFGNSKRVDEKLARLDAKLVAALEKVKRDKAAIYQWLNYFYDEANKQKILNRHQQETIDRLRALLTRADVVMDTAAIHGVRSILPPVYQDSWAECHTDIQEELKKDPKVSKSDNGGASG